MRGAAFALAVLSALASTGPAARAGDPDERPGYARFQRKPEKLSPEEFARMRVEVLRRCQLGERTRDASAPWYFHFELGRTLARAGDPQRALDAFLAAALRRPKSQADARLYGMWFTDYFPYFEIARAHAELGNWECAREALAVSEKEGEMRARRAELQELRALVLDHAPEPKER